jgi:hypothetical protein
LKVLVDQSLPLALDGLPNAYGLTLVRLTGERSDADVLHVASAGGFDAVVLLGAEIVSRSKIRDLARDLQLTIVCAIENEPLDADTNLRASFPTFAKRIAEARGSVLWLGRSGLRPETSA